MKKVALIFVSLIALFAGFETWSSSYPPKVAVSAENAQKLVELQMAFVEGAMTKKEYEKAKSEILNGTHL